MNVLIEKASGTDKSHLMVFCHYHRIEDNVDDAHENISRTKDYLLGVYSSLSSNRPLVIKSALVILVFILLFVLFVL